MTQTNETTSIVPNGYWGTVPPTKRPLGNGPLLQWFSALPAGNRLAIGWHIQCSRCSEELTQALRSLMVERITVFHRMSGQTVEYWSLGSCRLYILCNGFSDPWEMKQNEEREGLGYGWIESKQHSKLKVKALVADLVEAGYVEPFVISLEGMITECFLEALQKQFDVLDAFELISSGQSAPFWGFSLELVPAEKPKMVGSRGKQSPIVPMVAQVPASIDEAYLAEHVMPQALIAAIVEKDMIGKAVQWSVEVSRRISAGADREEWETEAYEAAIAGQDEEPAPEPATKLQWASIEKLCQFLKRPVPSEALTFEDARGLIARLSAEFQARKASAKSNGK